MTVKLVLCKFPSRYVLIEHDRIDNTSKLLPDEVGASVTQRQWAQLSLQGDIVTVAPLPTRAYLQSLDMEVGFIKPKFELAEQFSVEEMVNVFIRGLKDTIFVIGEISVFDFHGQQLKAVVKGLSLVDVGGRQSEDFGILHEKTDVNFMKAGDSLIKLKSSSKRYIYCFCKLFLVAYMHLRPPPNAILAPNFKFEDMGIGGLDSEFSGIFRRAFASRVFPPGLVEKLGIQHVKGSSS